MSMLPLLITKNEWNRIVKWTDENKEDPETARRREYVQYLNDKSAEMTKSWPNSLENVNKRNEEIRRARTQATEDANVRFYKRYLARKREDQQRMMYSARDTIFKNKDAPKLLLSGVVESVILKEREEQLKFNEKFVGDYEREQNRLNDEMIIRKAKESEQLNAEMKRRRFEVNKEHQRELLDQIKETEERNRKEYEEELAQQKQDITNSQKEIDMLKKFEEDSKEATKQRIWRDNKQSIAECEQKRREAEARARMDDQLLEVLKRSQCLIEKKRKTVEKEIRDEKLRVLEAISAGLKNDTSERDAKEQANLERALREQDAAVEARYRRDMEKKERQKREKIALHEQFLRDEAQRLHVHETMQNFALMNRFKNEELYAEYKERLRQENKRKKDEFREEILKLKKEVEERNAKEKAETRYFYGELARQKFRDADNKLFAHAAGLIEEAQRNGRPTLPIYKALDRYCKHYRLYPMPELPASLQKLFPQYRPVDGSQLDPGYREPPPPPPATDPDAEDEEEDVPDPNEKRDGLQSLIKAATKPNSQNRKSSPKETEKQPSPKEVKKSDGKSTYSAPGYARQSRANGLQQRPPTEIVLPPITVVTYPCKRMGIVTNAPIQKKSNSNCDFMLGEI